MKTHYKDVAVIFAESNPTEMHLLAHKTDDFVEMVRKAHPAEVEKFIFEIKMLATLHFDRETAEYVVCKMKNADGTTGEHWDYDTAKKVMHENGYTFECGDWYYVLNMMYSDYHCAEKTDEYYIKLACQFLSDVDAPKGKAKRYYMAMNF